MCILILYVYICHLSSISYSICSLFCFSLRSRGARGCLCARGLAPAAAAAEGPRRGRRGAGAGGAAVAAAAEERGGEDPNILSPLFEEEEREEEGVGDREQGGHEAREIFFILHIAKK